jgi:VWFA-related protein
VAQDPQAPVFRSSIDLVHLDVSVLDRDRRPVRGLRDVDFTIYQNDVPQRVVAFSAVDVPDTAATPAPPWTREVPAEIQTNEGSQDAEGRLFVLLLDDAMMPPHPGPIATARDVARKFLDRVTPADRVAVVFSMSGRNQNFTNDRPRLLAAIDSLNLGYATYLGGWDSAVIPPAVTRGEAQQALGAPLSDPDISYRQASMATLRSVAETLINAPQRRKALVFISPGITVDAASAAMPLRVDAQDPNSQASMKEANLQLVRGMPELFLRMRRANVTIYPIDPFGADGLRQYVQTAASGVRILSMATQPPPAFYDYLNPGSTPPPPWALAQHFSSLNLQFLDDAAKNTGGLALINTNDFDAGLDRIFEENQSYYLIGFPAPAGQKPGSWHRLRVEVNRPGVTVRTRSGYLTDEVRTTRAKTVSPLDRAIMGPVADGAFPMRVAVAPFHAPGRKEALVTVVLGLAQPAVPQRTTYEVELQTNAYEIDGRPRLVGARQTVRVVLVPQKGVETPRYEVLSTIALPPGRYELRMSAHRALDTVSGSLYADLEVPDFSKAALSVSGVLVEMEPPGPSAPPAAFDAIVPVTPTSNRQFGRGDLATVFMRVYQREGGSVVPVTVTTRLVNGRGDEIGKGEDRLETDQFHTGGPAADYRFSIPLEPLPPGPYLLTFTFTEGRQIVERTLQFVVTGR